jgi:hypothetical protein
MSVSSSHDRCCLARPHRGATAHVASFGHSISDSILFVRQLDEGASEDENINNSQRQMRTVSGGEGMLIHDTRGNADAAVHPSDCYCARKAVSVRRLYIIVLGVSAEGGSPFATAGSVTL